MFPDRDEIPFLFLHGAWVWKAALVVLCVVVVAAVHGVHRLVARFQLARRVATLNGGVVRGTLRANRDGDIAATLHATAMESQYAVKARTATTSWSATGLWIETATGPVVLDGDIQVVAGHAACARNGVPARVPDTLLATAREHAGWLHRRKLFVSATTHSATLTTLRTGDEVIATGELDRAPGREPVGYRGSDVTWTLRPARSADLLDAGESIRLAARRPRVAFVRLPLPVVVGIVVATAFIGYNIERSLGEGWRSECKAVVDQPRAAGLSSHSRNAPFELPRACELEMAMPDSSYSLVRLQSELERSTYRDQAVAQEIVTLADALEGCRGVVQRLHQFERFDEAAAYAHACGDARGEQAALMASARFAEAAAIEVPPEKDEPPHRDIEPLIAAGRWLDAANLADEQAARIVADPPAPSRVYAVTLSAVHYRCLADLFRHYGGDRDAVVRIRANYETMWGHPCAAMLAEAEPATRLAMLAPATQDQPHLASNATEMLAYAAGVPTRPSSISILTTPEQMLVKPSELRYGRRPMAMAWLAKHERARLASSEGGPQLMLRWLAVAQTFDGDIAGANATARRAIDRPLTPDEDDYTTADRRHLLAAIALYTPATDAPTDFAPPTTYSPTSQHTIDADLGQMIQSNWFQQFGRLRLRANQPIGDAYFGPDDDYAHALDAARTGNGTPLLDYLVKPHTRWWNDGDLLAVFPRIATERDAIRRQLVWSTSDSQRFRVEREFPFEMLGYAIERRGLMTAMGATEDAAKWDGIYRRIDAVLMDRRKLVALLLWNP